MRFVAPSGERYVEPFAGRAAVFWLAAMQCRYKQWWLNDPETAEWLRIVCTRDVGRLVPPFVDKRDAASYRARAAAGDPVAKVLEAEIVYCGATYKQGALVGGAPKGRKDMSGHSSGTLPGFRKRLQAAAMIAARCKPRITDWDWKAVLAECGKGDFVYLDPPYEGTSGRLYDNLPAGDYVSMAEALAAATFRWALSSYEGGTFSRVFGEPAARRRVDVTSKYACKNGRGKAMEAIWTGGG